MFTDQISGYLGFLTGMIAVGALLDQVTPVAARNSIALFIFGLSDGVNKSFEKGVISAVIGIFCDNKNRLKIARVLVYSIICCSILLSVEYYTNGPVVKLEFLFILFILFCGIVTSVPFDYFSLFVSKTIFINDKYYGFRLPFFILADVFISAIPVLSLFVAIDIYANDLGIRNNDVRFDDNFFSSIIIFSLISNFLATIANSIAQIFMTLSGVIYRIIFIFLKLNNYFVIYTNFHNYPITFICTFSSIIIMCIEFFI